MKASVPSVVESVPRALAVVVMFHVTCLGWLIFRAESVEQIYGMLGSLGHGWEFTTLVAQYSWQLCVFCVPLVCVQMLQEYSGDLNLLRKLSLVPQTIVYSTVIIALLTLGRFSGDEFLYFQF